MFQKLEKKWKVSGGRLILVLLTFAVGGSLTGYLGKRFMGLTEIQSPLLYFFIYIVVVTLIWPLTVLAVSVVFGQFPFFKNYLLKMFSRLRTGANKSMAVENLNLEKDITSVPVSREQSPTLKRIAIFASGAGSNAQAILRHLEGNNAIKVGLIVCNKPGAGVIDIAGAAGVPVLLIEKEEFFRGESYVPQLKQEGIDFIVLAGFLWKIPQALIQAFPRKIVNLHPALLPKYGGKGMYGLNVHAAVIQNGEQESGITIHWVDEHYDSGDIIFQATCPVLPGDTPEELAGRIHRLEHTHFPVVITQILRDVPPGGD
ncbi:MAG TPA: phosphoribosylglycinamide formyltransferase [Flavisolibacter sp.]|nr:phosphoribosylglycinamide formyltransferase [Flavisolibacter sp.]